MYYKVGTAELGARYLSDHLYVGLTWLAPGTRSCTPLHSYCYLRKTQKLFKVILPVQGTAKNWNYLKIMAKVFTSKLECKCTTTVEYHTYTFFRSLFQLQKRTHKFVHIFLLLLKLLMFIWINLYTLKHEYHDLYKFHKQKFQNHLAYTYTCKIWTYFIIKIFIPIMAILHSAVQCIVHLTPLTFNCTKLTIFKYLTCVK